MAVNKNIKPKDISLIDGCMCELDPQDFIPLPPPYDKIEEQPGFKKLNDQVKESEVVNLDGVLIGGLPKPKNEKEEEEYVAAFIRDVQKLFTKEDNWSFLQPLVLSMKHGAKCESCSDHCPIYEASGGQ